MPPAVRVRLQEAAVAGFHDVVWVLVAASALGVLISLLVRDPAPARLDEISTPVN